MTLDFLRLQKNVIDELCDEYISTILNSDRNEDSAEGQDNVNLNILQDN